MAKTTEILESLVSKFEAFEQRLAALEAPKIESAQRVLSESVPTPEKAFELALDGVSEPIPFEIRKVVDEVLNKSFDVHIKSEPGRFRFTVLVPEKYSSLNTEQRKMMQFDMRPKMIDNAEGANGARLWCEKVFSSFNPAIQSIITSDRITNP